MRVLLLGASGFIGSYLRAFLETRGHQVVAAVRDPAAPELGDASQRPVAIDLNRDTTPEAWIPRLSGIDAVVNCAGVLQGSPTQSIEAIHHAAPVALFAACERVGVKRVVQISAISATREAATAYALTKLGADDDLRGRALDWVLLRPSLVLAPGAFGGTALFRALAALPFLVPVPGSGAQAFQPIWIEDLALVVARALETDALVHKTLDPVGPDVVSLRTILTDLRRWLGMRPARVVRIPMGLVRLTARWGDLFGGPANSTAVAQMEHGNTASIAAFREASGIEPRGWVQALAAHPAQWQDRWHARLYFVRPILRFALAALWIGSAFAGIAGLEAWAPPVASALGVSSAAATLLLASACGFDLVIGLLLLARWKPEALATVQFVAVLAYTALATFIAPLAWADPLGALLKNLPILGAILALAALEKDR